jgi:hypothetical protein
MLVRMTSPDTLEKEFTLATATARLDELRTREALGDSPLGREEALELLALTEVVARKAAYGRQLSIRTARATGASWSQIGAALGISKQSAWEAHTRWINEQAANAGREGEIGWDAAEAADARRMAGRAPE